ncbi:armadillo-like helical domain-containing protein 3 [Patiria miniata]|uniref:Armadillo-like helical domain-containing protein n=1 Tax=Patiria miniata TaxID=46514 RepID=A0A913Z1J2_PATMI|nr:armadillo-like helical domain-containing protein 3 [Patiria miniata]
MPRLKGPTLLRPGSDQKIALKEKILDIYDAFLKGQDASRGNLNFWDELFLLKANVKYIESELGALEPQQLLKIKDNINSLFYHSVATLKQDHPIRVVNALQTLCALVRGVHKRTLSDHGFDVINILIGFDSAEMLMTNLVERLNSILVGVYSVSLKNLALRLFLILATVTDNVSQNTILEYLMINSVFESIIQILANPTSRQDHGYEAVLLLTLLVNYRKYESANPYIVKLSIMDDELALTGLGAVISSTLARYNSQFKLGQDDTAYTGWFSAITNMVGNMFVGENSEHIQTSMDPDNCILLALYEAVHLNRNFLTVLSHNHAHPVQSLPSTTCPPSPPAVPSAAQNLHPEPSSPAPVSESPTNILVTFLSYCSMVMQDLKDEQRQNNTKLCLIILTCIAEDQYANSFLHDANLSFRVPLFRAPMRHRKATTEMVWASRPLACALLDLMVEFIMSHMMKCLPLELYLRCTGVIHRILCYQKKCRVRLQYPWKEVWTALISLLKFLLGNESALVSNYNIFELACQVVNLFNLFITYGDTFLPTPGSYDELYYELIRMHQAFDNLYSMALRHSTNNGEHKNTANKLTSSLVNIRAIINHFTPKIDSWSTANKQTALTEEQVLEVVRTNYDTLTLKLQDSLDQYVRYAEKPKETAFFTLLVRAIISDFRKNVIISNLEQQSVLQEFSTIQ